MEEIVSYSEKSLIAFYYLKLVTLCVIHNPDASF